MRQLFNAAEQVNTWLETNIFKIPNTNKEREADFQEIKPAAKKILKCIANCNRLSQSYTIELMLSNLANLYKGNKALDNVLEILKEQLEARQDAIKRTYYRK